MPILLFYRRPEPCQWAFLDLTEKPFITIVSMAPCFSPHFSLSFIVAARPLAQPRCYSDLSFDTASRLSFLTCFTHKPCLHMDTAETESWLHSLFLSPCVCIVPIATMNHPPFCFVPFLLHYMHGNLCTLSFLQEKEGRAK